MINIKIERYLPGNTESWVWVSVDGVDYDVSFDSENLNKIKVTKDDAEVELASEYYDALLERVRLLLTFFDAADLQAHIQELSEQAIAAMEQHLEQNAAGELKLHRAVKITHPQWGFDGIVTGVGFANGLYEVTYWAGNSGEPLVHVFHYHDLRAL
jgi:hypothetical protein